MLAVLSTICIIIGGLLLCVKNNIGKHKCDLLSASMSEKVSGFSDVPNSSTAPTPSSTTNNSQFEYSGITERSSTVKRTDLRSNNDQNNNQRHSSVRKLFSDEDTPVNKIDVSVQPTESLKVGNVLQIDYAVMPEVNFVEDPDDEEETDDTMFDVASIKTDPPTPLVTALADVNYNTADPASGLDETLH